MQRIMTFAIDDLVIDPESVAAQLTKMCSEHRPHYWVRGLCQLQDKVYFVLLAATAGEPREQCVIVPVRDVSDAGFTSMLDERWSAGFNCVGTVALGEGMHLILFTRPQDPPR